MSTQHYELTPHQRAVLSVHIERLAEADLIGLDINTIEETNTGYHMLSKQGVLHEYFVDLEHQGEWRAVVLP